MLGGEPELIRLQRGVLHHETVHPLSVLHLMIFHVYHQGGPHVRDVK